VPLLAAALLTAAAAPGGSTIALDGVEPGLWEFSRDATGQGARRGCMQDMILFATYAHAGDRCVRTILSDRPRDLIMSLECGPGDFGRSRVTVTTPRSLKLSAQGIHDGEPYDITAYARRVGECPVSARR
jgi:hypothetical protein